jgi:hypothetical protein
MNTKIDSSAESRRTQGGFGTSFPLEFLVLTPTHGLVDLSLTQATKGGGNPNKDERKMQMEEVREMGAPSSYLIGLLHNPSFAPGYN